MVMNQTNSVTGRQRRAIGVFPDLRDAEYALHELRDSGFPMDRVSVIAQDEAQRGDIAGAEVSDRVGNKADEGASIGALSGGALGGLTGLLVGLGTLAIPGIGPIMLAGATATALATTLAGGAIGAVAGGLLGALVGLGIPEERARVYNDRVSRGEYLVIVEGSDAEIARAEAILRQRGIQEYGVYDVPSTVATPATATSAVPTYPTTNQDAGVGLGRSKHAIGFFTNEVDAERAANNLRTAGFPMNQVSLVAHNFERRARFAGLDLRDRFDAMRLGLPADRARFYNDRITQGDYVILVNGNENEVHQAETILAGHRPQEWGIYDPTLVNSTGTVDTTPSVAHPTDHDRNPDRTPTAFADRVGQQKRAIGVFTNRSDAETALTELRNSGFSMDQVSIIAKDVNPNNPIAGMETTSYSGNKADESAKAGAATGGVLGSLGGLLVGLGTLAIPGVGPVVLGGAAATAIATALSGGAIGAVAGGLAGGLVGIGIPEDKARAYNERFERGDYLVIIDGVEDELHRVETILNRRGIRDWEIFNASDVNTSRTTTSRVNTTRADDTTRVAERKPDVTIVDRRDEAR